MHLAGLRLEDVGMQVLQWREQSACRGIRPSLFYPENDLEEQKAKAVCGLCSVRECCLELALSTVEPDGIWGGLNVRQRRRIIRGRAQIGEYVDIPYV